MPRPADRPRVVLCILDGFGISRETRGNAIAAARMPNYRALIARDPYTEIGAGGEAVGLPAGQQGNSEVGHLNLGAGRVVYQSITRIDRAIDDGSFARNPVLLRCLDHVKRSGGTFHLFGLVSPGGVHSSMKHLWALLDAASAAGVRARVAAFLDGRDTPPTSAGAYLDDLQRKCAQGRDAAISMICGRYYAMDRDKRWERTRIAYDALVRGRALTERSAGEALAAAYARGESDEFVKPAIVGSAEPIVHDGDACLFFNFRPDRARQLTRAFSDPLFSEFQVERFANFIFATITLYEDSFPNPVMFGRIFETQTLGEVVADAGLRQLRLAETEKYAHVTYFFSGGREEPFPGEDRELIPSARDVGTYDRKPEMRAPEITAAAVAAVRSRMYDLIVMNYANPDMVGHTGKWEAIIAALEVVDDCLAKLDAAARDSGAVMIVTADHGNAEEKIDLASGKALTAHTANPVPLVLINDGAGPLESGGRLCDVAPTICRLMGLNQPPEMTGKSLLA